MSVCWAIVAARNTLRPMRPNPLMPTRTAMSLPLGEVWNCGAREGDAVETPRTDLFQGARCLGERRSRGKYIIDNDQCPMIIDHWTLDIRDSESCAHVR